MHPSLEYLLQNRSDNEHPMTFDPKCAPGIEDPNYQEFINKSSGGFFFSRGLIIYSWHSYKDITGIVNANTIIQQTYPRIFDGFIFFGCDLFGHQFAYQDNSIYFVNIESTETEFLCGDFGEFADLLQARTQYFTGQNLALQYEQTKQPIPIQSRLVPIKPFIIGGEYKVENLFDMPFEKAIAYMGEFAMRVRNLPDGTKITLKTTGGNSDIQ